AHEEVGDRVGPLEVDRLERRLVLLLELRGDPPVALARREDRAELSQELLLVWVGGLEGRGIVEEARHQRARNGLRGDDQRLDLLEGLRGPRLPLGLLVRLDPEELVRDPVRDDVAVDALGGERSPPPREPDAATGLAEPVPERGDAAEVARDGD